MMGDPKSSSGSEKERRAGGRTSIGLASLMKAAFSAGNPVDCGEHGV